MRTGCPVSPPAPDRCIPAQRSSTGSSQSVRSSLCSCVTGGRSGAETIPGASSSFVSRPQAQSLQARQGFPAPALPRLRQEMRQQRQQCCCEQLGCTRSPSPVHSDLLERVLTEGNEQLPWLLFILPGSFLRAAALLITGESPSSVFSNKLV